MARPEAAVFSPRDRVVIPVRNLRDLRSAIDVLLSSVPTHRSHRITSTRSFPSHTDPDL